MKTLIPVLFAITVTTLGLAALHTSGSVEVMPNGGIIIKGADK